MAHEIEARLENLGRVGASFMTWSPWADGLCQDVSVKRLVEKHEHVLRVTTPPPSCSAIDSGNFRPRQNKSAEKPARSRRAFRQPTRSAWSFPVSLVSYPPSASISCRNGRLTRVSNRWANVGWDFRYTLGTTRS